TKDSRVPDDYRNQASGYRAGWNDALASDLAQQPAADGGFTAADMMDARQEGRKEAQQPAAVDEAMADAAAIDKAWDRFKAAVGRQPATDEAQKIIRELAALYDGLANGNSSAEERATRLAERAAALAT